MRLIDADAIDLEYEVDMAEHWKTAHEFANLIKYAPTVEPFKWIQCSEEMPEEYEPVITYTARGQIKIMELVMEWNGKMWQDEADYLYELDYVQAWMGLPSKPVLK